MIDFFPPFFSLLSQQFSDSFLEELELLLLFPHRKIRSVSRTFIREKRWEEIFGDGQIAELYGLMRSAVIPREILPIFWMCFPQGWPGDLSQLVKASQKVDCNTRLVEPLLMSIQLQFLTHL